MQGKLKGLIAAALVLGSAAAWSQSYPVKPVRIVVPFAAGGSTDILARNVAQRLNEALRSPVVIDNRGGAGGVIGAELVAKSPPDGYTILVTTAGVITTTPSLHRKLPYDPPKDFAPIGIIAALPNMLVVHPSLPVKSVNDLVRLAKSKPGELSYSSGGVGTSLHLAGALLSYLAGIDIVHVAYKGGGPAMNDLLGGQVQMGILIMSTIMPHVEAGKLRAIAVAEAVRAKALPNLPTIGESIPGFAMPDIWIGLLGPRGLPAAIVNRINTEANKAIQAPEVRPRLEAAGYEVSGNTPAEFAQTIRASIEQYRRATTVAGVKPE